MRLLESRGGVIRLTRDLSDGEVPSYAILSHTWNLDPDGEEVTFRDLVDGTGVEKTGYNKIKFCAARAQSDGLYYFWVDTCCIDKANSTELSEAINSMYQWYRRADRCYVYLSDVSAREFIWERSWEADFRASRWFTRGWTLQELLAPSSVEFFTVEGHRLGDKMSLQQQIHDITGIATTALQNTASLSRFNTEELFRWAANRNTTKGEDWAYCLLGIFGVYMPLIYGEGKKNAVRRLRKEIADAENREDSPEPSQGIEHLQPAAKTAVLSYEYSKADDCAVDLRKGECISNTEKSDNGWWMGTNSDSGRDRSNNVLPLPALQAEKNDRPRRTRKPVCIRGRTTAANGSGVTATALRDFEPVDDGDITLKEGDKVTDVSFSSEGWWAGYCNGKWGTFPANRVSTSQESPQLS